MIRWLRRKLCRWLGAPVCRLCLRLNQPRCIRRCNRSDQERIDHYVETGCWPA